ncbi:MAG: hypothetical protein DDT27_01493 [Dehalococcoidia bacterium]|nr:hypothetical protein [Chloroflexota bacterium]MBT9162928.1 hypothetical protein [Chloroflexota bacterium]
MATVVTKATEDLVSKCVAVATDVLRLPTEHVWLDYDKEADVLYFNFRKPSHADDSELTDDDMIIRYEKGEIVGITILNASRRKMGYGL